MRFLERRSTMIIILGVSAAAALGAYLIGSQWVLRIGFPLDDAWIHQTYARSLGNRGVWEFLPGTTSAGSTAPAWTLLLSIGYWLNLNFYAWAYLLGWVLLWISGVTAALGFKWLEPKYSMAFSLSLMDSSSPFSSIVWSSPFLDSKNAHVPNSNVVVIASSVCSAISPILVNTLS